MPWKVCSVMDERLQFVGRRLVGEPMAERSAPARAFLPNIHRKSVGRSHL
jgi:hypothetical protein